MAVLVEAISVVIKAERIVEGFRGGWEAFTAHVLNATMCADGELVRVGFTNPDDVRVYIEGLETLGIVYLADGQAVDERLN